MFQKWKKIDEEKNWKYQSSLTGGGEYPPIVKRPIYFIFLSFKDFPKGRGQKKIVEFSSKVGGWGQQWTDFPLFFFFFWKKYEFKTLDVALGKTPLQIWQDLILMCSAGKGFSPSL